MKPRHRLLVALVSPLLGLLLAEGSARVLDRASVPQPEVAGVLVRPSLVPGLTFENRAGAERRITYRDRRGAAPRVVVHRVNAQGFRGPEVERRPAPDTFRIVCLGDSHTFGAGVADDEPWPARLEGLLAREPSRFGPAVQRVEVVNAGVNAYDTRRERLLLEHRTLDLEPDLVLLQYHANDTSPRNVVGWKPPYDDLLWRLSDPDRSDWIGALRRRSRLVDVVLDRVRSRRGALDESGASLEGYAPTDDGWRRVTTALLEARDLCASRDVAFGVVLFPSLARVDSGLASRVAFERVRAFCERSGIPTYDGEADLLALAQRRGDEVAELRVHPHDPHAGPRAHEAFAAGVAAWLTAWRPQAPRSLD